MAIHQIPRNVKGESRLLYIFTMKSLIFTVVAGIIGIIIYSVFYSMFLSGTTAQLIVILIHAALGFGIATIKIPEGSDNSLLKKLGGEYIDEVLLRAIKFKLKKKRIYLYTKEETK